MTMIDQEAEASLLRSGESRPLSDATPISSSSHPRLKSSSSRSSLLLLSNAATDPLLFSFDLVKKLNQQHLASIPPHPLSAIAIAQHQQQTKSYQARRRLHCISTATSADTSGQTSAALDSAASPADSPHQSSHSHHLDNALHLPLSQLRRASAPEAVTTISTHQTSSSNEPSADPSQGSSSDLPSQTSRERLPHRRSLDEVSLRRLLGKKPAPSNPTSPSQQSDPKMAATLGYNSSELFGGFNAARFANEDGFPPSFTPSRRPTIVTQTRELYLHPSQIFTPDPSIVNNNDASGYFDPSFNSNGNATPTGSNSESTIALPPMLTLEEIMQPHVFGKQESTEASAPNIFGAAAAPKSPAALSNRGSPFPGSVPPDSAFPSYTQFSVSIGLLDRR